MFIDLGGAPELWHLRGAVAWKLFSSLCLWNQEEEKPAVALEAKATKNLDKMMTCDGAEFGSSTGVSMNCVTWDSLFTSLSCLIHQLDIINVNLWNVVSAEWEGGSWRVYIISWGIIIRHSLLLSKHGTCHIPGSWNSKTISTCEEVAYCLHIFLGCLSVQPQWLGHVYFCS